MKRDSSKISPLSDKTPKSLKFDHDELDESIINIENAGLSDLTDSAELDNGMKSRDVTPVKPKIPKKPTKHVEVIERSTGLIETTETLKPLDENEWQSEGDKLMMGKNQRKQVKKNQKGATSPKSTAEPTESTSPNVEVSEETLLEVTTEATGNTTTSTPVSSMDTTLLEVTEKMEVAAMESACGVQAVNEGAVSQSTMQQQESMIGMSEIGEMLKQIERRLLEGQEGIKTSVRVELKSIQEDMSKVKGDMLEFKTEFENKMERVGGLEVKIDALDEKVVQVEEDLGKTVSEASSQSERCSEMLDRVMLRLGRLEEENKRLKMRQNDQEDRSKRDNLIIKGIPEGENETDEETQKLVNRMIKERFGLSGIKWVRVHRIGARREDKKAGEQRRTSRGEDRRKTQEKLNDARKGEKEDHMMETNEESLDPRVAEEREKEAIGERLKTIARGSDEGEMRGSPGGRPIVVKFQEYPVREAIWKRRRELAGWKFYLDEQYSRETELNRRALFPYQQALRENGVKCFLNVDKLIVGDRQLGDRPYRNVFPDLQALELRYATELESSSQRNNVEAFVFFGRTNPLSNHHRSEIHVAGTTYHTVEHFYMLEKAKCSNDQRSMELIMTTEDPMEVKRVGSKIATSQKWRQVREQVMKDALQLKFNAHVNLREYLLSTGQKVLGEACKSDEFWGIGMALRDNEVLKRKQWKTNKLGALLMEIRHNYQK